jgi:hypothetical protein
VENSAAKGGRRTSHIYYDYGEAYFEHLDYFNDEMHLNVTIANCFTQKLAENKVL